MNSNPTRATGPYHARRMTWRAVARTIVLALVSAILLFMLWAYGLLDFARVGTAFKHRQSLLALDIVCILIMSLLAIARHAWALSVLGVPIPLGRIAAANLIGQGVGQWLPGSMAMTEGLRIGLLLGRRGEGATQAGPFIRIAMASLGDRVIGLGVMFLSGGLATLAIAFTRPRGPGDLLPILAAGLLLVGALCLTLPLSGDTPFVRGLARMLAAHQRAAFVGRLAARSAAAVRHVAEASSEWRRRRIAIPVAVLLSAAACLTNPLAMFLASVAVGYETPFLVMAAALPITIVSLVLPTGFAGFGGPQLMFAAVFALFGVPVPAVLAMTLLQSTLVLSVQTALAFAGLIIPRGQASVLAG